MAKNNKPKGKLIWKILCGVFAFLFCSFGFCVFVFGTAFLTVMLHKSPFLLWCVPAKPGYTHLFDFTLLLYVFLKPGSRTSG